MSKQVIRSLVDQFIANGGVIYVMPTRTAFGGGSRQRRLKERDDTHA